jgi:carboxyl-terminal processing protease
MKSLKKKTRKLLKSLDEYFGFMNDLDRNDWFSVYINSITARFDPHTNLLEKRTFWCSGKLEGGARLQKKNDYTEISELISGGPAWRGGSWRAGDVVMKVAQGMLQAVDVGMRLDDVVKKN